MERPGAPFGEGFALAAEEEADLRSDPRPFPAPEAERWGGIPPPHAREAVRSTLPGRGSGAPGCGRLFPRYACETHLEATIGRRECLRRECPLCAGACLGGRECPTHLPAHPGGKWAHREARGARERIEDFLEQHGISRLPFRQVVYSPRPDRFAESSSHVRIVSRIRARAEALVRRFAWRGMYLGTVVVHLYRGCDGRYEEWGPHAHVLCPGVDVRAWRAYSNREWNRYHRETGEVLKQIRYESGEWVSYRGRGLERHLVYELGHAAILPDRHALSWFGDLKTWAQPEIPPGEEEVPCCTWGDPMAPFSWRWGLPEIDEDAASFVAIAPDHTPIEFTIIGGDPPDDNRVLTDEEIAERLSRTETREEYDARILREQDEEDRRRWGP